MPTTIKYIKALVAIRLFNQSLWMEEESISAIPESRFNSQEVQDAITAGQLVEVSENDLPTDVVSPIWRLKGDWDPSDGQLPIGRRYGDSYRILPPGGVVGSVELRAGQRVIFTSLSTFEILGEGAFNPATLTLSGLSDVDATGVLDGYILKYNVTTQKFEAVELTLTTNLQDLDDVDDTNLLDGTVPVFNQTAGKFEFESPKTNLRDLLDVDATNVVDGTVPVFNQTADKFEFQLPKTNLRDLLDVDATSLTDSSIPIYNVDTDKFEVTPYNTANGFVAITDITPQNIADNVYDKTLSDGDNVLQSCTTSTNFINVHVIAITGKTKFRPDVTVNSLPVTMTRVGSTDTWSGIAPITLVGAGLHTITALHDEGASDTAEVTVEAPPQLVNMEFSGAYPNPGQVEHAAGQSLSLTITSDQPFIEVESVVDTNNAIVAGSTTLGSATTSTTLSVVVADRGNTTITSSALIRVRTEAGTWSSIYASGDFGNTDGTHTLELNNTRPSAIFGTVSYPVGQGALKLTESGSVIMTYLNVDTANFYSNATTPQLNIPNPTTIISPKTFNRISGSAGYNVSTPNLFVDVTRTANATSSTSSKVINIADDFATITSITKPARLRSGVTPQVHSLVANCNQLTQSLDITVPEGTLQGASWTTSNGGLSYSRSIAIADSNVKGTYEMTVYLVNLAGRVTTEADITPSILQYIIGGFTSRDIKVTTAWAGGVSPSERETNIGTQVQLTSKLVATVGSSVGRYTASTATFTSTSNPAITDYAITGPSGILPTVQGDGTLSSPANLVYVRDTFLVAGNNGSFPITIEELI